MCKLPVLPNFECLICHYHHSNTFNYCIKIYKNVVRKSKKLELRLGRKSPNEQKREDVVKRTGKMTIQKATAKHGLYIWFLK